MNVYPSVTIIIRTINEASNLDALLKVLKSQNYPGSIEIVVVDNESTDRTPEVARRHGCKIVTIGRSDFTFPRSLNMGAAAATGEILVYLVGHSLPFNQDWLRQGMRHFSDPDVAGIYSPAIPRKKCTLSEAISYYFVYLAARIRGAHQAKWKLGILGATNAAVRRSLWEGHPFDEHYELGGEDTAWAAWAISQGYQIICDYRFAVRHSHGLGMIGLIKQALYWNKLLKPTKFDLNEFRFRKDLNLHDNHR